MPSGSFADAFCDSASPVQDCELCGRVHFAETGENMEEGELDGLLAKQKENPIRYVSHPDLVSWGVLGGFEAVRDCPCNGANLFERLFWSHRHVIASFFTEKASANLRKAEKHCTTAGLVAAATER